MKLTGQEFRDEEIALDFHQFESCRFVRCKLVFHGYAGAALDRCEFIDVQWGFGGPAAATMGFLAAMYHGGGEVGRSLVEGTLQAIRTSPTGPPQGWPPGPSAAP